ncbi:MAG: hypothetical protein IPF66_17340 [Holophagales bacterium]|nr:hypothetical protein [Holophagales bacterium]
MGTSDDHPYVDEASLTIEHQPGRDTSIGDDINRRFRNLMGMVNTNDDHERVTGISNLIAGGASSRWSSTATRSGPLDRQPRRAGLRPGGPPGSRSVTAAAGSSAPRPV